jgi:DNA-binding NarL/FixJ family response regulator
LLLDINLPGKSGIESIHLFKEENPLLQMVMMTGLDDDDNIFNAILAGADGYLLKKTPPARVISVDRGRCRRRNPDDTVCCTESDRAFQTECPGAE